MPYDRQNNTDKPKSRYIDRLSILKYDVNPDDVFEHIFNEKPETYVDTGLTKRLVSERAGNQ